MSVLDLNEGTDNACLGVQVLYIQTFNVDLLLTTVIIYFLDFDYFSH